MLSHAQEHGQPGLALGDWSEDPAAAQSFFDHANELKLGARAKRPWAGSIGPSTTAVMKQLGVPVDFEAAEASLDSLVEALLGKLGQ